MLVVSTSQYYNYTNESLCVYECEKMKLQKIANKKKEILKRTLLNMSHNYC